jgi:hypothetical protein
MEKISTIALAVSVFAVAVAAQSAQAPPTSAPQAPPSVQEPAQRPPTSTPPAVPPGASAKADNITVTGCISRSPQSSAAGPSTPGAVGTAGSSSRSDGGFMLNVAKPSGAGAAPGASPAPGAPPAPGASSAASSYKLDADDSKLSPHVGHKVEITGSLDRASSSSPSSSPRLKVDSVKMIATSCSD